MAGRYSRLYSLPENLYIEGAPVVVSAGALLKDDQTGKVLAQLKFKNITPKFIKALKVSVDAFDVSGVKLQGVDEYQYLDLAARRDEFFGSKDAFPLPDNVTRSFTVTVKSVIFSDGSSWENTGAEILPVAEQLTAEKALGNLTQQYLRDTDNASKYVVTDDRDLWICRCGAVNKNDEDTCHKCKMSKAAMLADMDIETLKQHKAEREEAERKAEEERMAREEAARIERERKAEEDRIRAAANKKKAKKLAAIISPIVVVVAVVVILTIMVFIPNSKYNNAVALMNAGQYEEAIAAFTAMDGYKDSNAQIENCKIGILDDKYDAAVVLMNNGDYEGAIVAFTEIINHKDSATQIENCEIEIAYEDAVALQNNGEYVKAIQLYEQLPGYKDTADRIIECQYLRAMAYYDNRNYLDAAIAFTEIPDYKDSVDKVCECYYLHAVSKFKTQPSRVAEVEKIIEYFELANGYGDSAEYIVQCGYILTFLTGDEMLGYINADLYERIISTYSSLPEDFEYKGVTPADRIAVANHFKSAIQMCGTWKSDNERNSTNYGPILLTGKIDFNSNLMTINVGITALGSYTIKIEAPASLGEEEHAAGRSGHGIQTTRITCQDILQISGSYLIYKKDYTRYGPPVQDFMGNWDTVFADQYYYFVKSSSRTAG